MLDVSDNFLGFEGQEIQGLFHIEVPLDEFK